MQLRWRFGSVFFATLVPQLALGAAQFFWSEPKLVNFTLAIYSPLLPLVDFLGRLGGLRSGGLEGLGLFGFIILASPLIGGIVYSLVAATLAYVVSAANRHLSTRA